MAKYKQYVIVLISSLIIPLGFSFGVEEGTNNSAPLGFDFGISKKQAIEIIKNNGKEIMENSEDSKKIRTIIFDGAIVELPLDAYKVDVQTRLEFFNNKLMSSLLVLKPEDQSDHGDVADTMYKFLSSEYGDPDTKEKILDFYTWTWLQPEMKVVYTASSNNVELKVDYTYEPVSKKKAEKELKEKREGELTDPVKEMFIDGTYSRPADRK